MGRKLGVPNKITAAIKEKLASVLDQAMDSIDIKTMTKAESLGYDSSGYDAIYREDYAYELINIACN